MTAPIRPPWPGVDPKAVHAAHDMIAASERPVCLIGGGGWDMPGRQGRAALTAFREFCEQAHLPVVTAFRWQDLIDNTSPVFVGDAGFGMAPHIRQVLSDSDLILAVNIRFGETATDGYSLFDLPEMRQRLIHVHPSDRELGKIYQTPHAVHASPARFVAALAARGIAPAVHRETWVRAARDAFLAAMEPPPQPGALDMGAVMAHLREVLPEDAIVTNGAGNFAIWPGRHLLYGSGNRLIAAQAGAMGAGLPAAIACRLAEPERMVVCFTGDGDLQMTLQELGTGMQADALPILLVLNNGTYGTIRMHQERAYPGRVSGTDLVNPDFVALGRAYGMHAEQVGTANAFPGAFDRARRARGGALLELVLDKEALTPHSTLTQIREAASAA